jgi:hypothetical protein
MRGIATFVSVIAIGAGGAGAVAAQTAPSRETSGGWALGIAGQVDDSSNDSLLATINWGVTPATWLSFSAGRSRSPSERAGVQADTLVASIDQRLEKVGYSLELERWGDADALETDDVRASVYFERDRWRFDVAYEMRDLDIPFTLTGPLGNTVRRRAEVSGDSLSLDARVNLAQRWRLFLGAAEYDYERQLNLLPRIDRLNLLGTSTLTLANSLIDHERSAGVEHDLGRMVLSLRFATDESAVDGTRFDTTEAALLVPAGRRMDVEVNVGRGRSELADTGWYGGILLLLYGG